MIQGLIFDFDGLILDTELSAFQSWQELYQVYGCSLPLEEWAVCIGGSDDLFDPCAHLEAQLGRTLVRADILAQRRRRHLAMLEAEPLLPGIEEYLAQAKRLHLKIGLASSSPHAWVDNHLSRLGILEHFDTLKCADDVTHTKPNPELYLAVLAEVGIAGHQAIALEDSPNGVRAAQRAGIFCVAVPNMVTCQLPLEHADMRLRSLAEMSLEQLLVEVQQRRSLAEAAHREM